MLTPTAKIWHNGRLIDWNDANIHVLSHVTSYGSSVFEGIRCYTTPSGPAIFRVREHIRRWCEEHARTPVARFVYRSWLDAGGELELIEQPLRGWLASNWSTPAAKFIRIAWARAGGDPSRLERHHDTASSMHRPGAARAKAPRQQNITRR